MPPVPSTKSEAIRLAIEAGFTKPREGAAWIEKTWGGQMTVTPDHFSSVKSELRKAAQPALPAAAAAPPAPPAPPKPQTDGFRDVVKALRLMTRAIGLTAVQDAVRLAYSADRATVEEALELITDLAGTDRSGTPTAPR